MSSSNLPPVSLTPSLSLSAPTRCHAQSSFAGRLPRPALLPPPFAGRSRCGVDPRDGGAEPPDPVERPESEPVPAAAAGRVGTGCVDAPAPDTGATSSSSKIIASLSAAAAGADAAGARAPPIRSPRIPVPVPAMNSVRVFRAVPASDAGGAPVGALDGAVDEAPTAAPTAAVDEPTYLEGGGPIG